MKTWPTEWLEASMQDTPFFDLTRHRDLKHLNLAAQGAFPAKKKHSHE
jgi:hypothetical protein